MQLSPDQIRMAGLATAEVAYRPLAKEIRTVGFVTYDQSRMSRVVTRTAGYVEKLYVDKTFQDVKRGEPLAELYSPDLLSTSEDLMLALDRGANDLVASSKERLRLLGVNDNEVEEIVATRALLVALRHGDREKAAIAGAKLRSLGLTDSEITAIKTTRRAPTNLVIRSPVNGHVITKEIVQGSRVAAGATLFDVADLSHAWIEADVFETDIPLLHKGQEIEATVEGLPNRVFHGHIVLVHPHVETASRTNRIRIDLPNPGHALRPGMYATVTIKAPFADAEPFKTALAAAKSGPTGNDDKSLIAYQATCPVTGNKLGSMGPPIKRLVGDKAVFLCCPGCIEKLAAAPDEYLARLAPPPAHDVLTVPERAVIDTGLKKIVYVEREPGVFDGVEVQLGPESDGLFPVVKGLHAGERVAAAGAFLVDADTRLDPAAGAAYLLGPGNGTAVAGAKGEERRAENSEVMHPSAAAVAPAAIMVAKPTADDLKNIDKLPPADRAAALAQQMCPISEDALGAMGVPVKLELTPGKFIFICCPHCREEAMHAPQQTLDKLTRIARVVKQQLDRQ